MKSLLSFFLFCFLFNCTTPIEQSMYLPTTKLSFNNLASTWDEATPLGNGMLGCLVWEKENKLRFSLDRADLWDLRPMANIDFEKWSFQDVYEHWKNDKYKAVQEVFDEPYDALAGPSKIPTGALEFEIRNLGLVKSVELETATATCTVTWENGTVLTAFVQADQSVGWYKFENVPDSIHLTLIPPAYNLPGDGSRPDQAMGDLDQLGYPQGVVEVNDGTLTYNQEGWGGFTYQIHTEWERTENELTGCWSVSAHNPDWEKLSEASVVVAEAWMTGYNDGLTNHKDWWAKFWQQSHIAIPDRLLQHQYDMEMYKFGSVARSEGPPVSLQAVWTADNGKLPPWKGDFHHDLNTQLSYWPAYTGNQLELEIGFLNWLWEHRPVFLEYTRNYFEVGGMNVPGVTTLEGEPMGGWIQYSMGQTVGAWLGQHFYWHWKYSMDRDFLRNRAYPWIRDVAIFLDEISERTQDGRRKLRMSSSPEIFNNSREAWFAETTNFDLGLIRWTYAKAAELAAELGVDRDVARWEQLLSEWGELAVDPKTGLMFAPGFPYNESHRHFSHLMSYHPLGLLDYSHGNEEQVIIDHTLRNLEAQGTDWWTGYSFSWAGSLYARVFEGENAARVLRTFAECFCLPNSFHVNGDQCKAGHSNFTYRPFTLEGNFAFAAGIQEMLIQSHTGVIHVFPAIPEDWREVSFEDLLAQGAFLVSAERKEGHTVSVEVYSEKGGQLRLINPFGGQSFTVSREYVMDGDVIVMDLSEGEKVGLEAAGMGN